MVSYFNLLKVCMFIFFIFTLLHIPAYSIYKGYSNYEEDSADNFLKTLTLGNMGFSEPRCVSSGMASNKIMLSCHIGNISQIEEWGF